MAHTDDWHRADIKAALEKRGSSMAAVARHHDIDTSTVRKAISGFRPMTRVKAFVADAIGVPPQTIWPSLFDKDGQPIPAQRRRRKDSRSLRGRNVSARRQRAA